MGRGDMPGAFEQVVLLAVARLSGEGYGVGIRAEIERRTGRDVSAGSVYATLSRLEEKGLLSSWEGDPLPQRGGRARRYFRIERAGVAALQDARATLDALWDGLELDALAEEA